MVKKEISMRAKSIVQGILTSVGIQLNGTAPHDIRVADERFYRRVLAGGSLALGESYVDGWWECDRLDQFFATILRNDIYAKAPLTLTAALETAYAMLANRQTKARSFDNAGSHYNIGNDLYEAMLGRAMAYTCAYWKDAADLDAAQDAKLDLVCRKVGLRAGQKILDIGCGWGSFAKFAAERYGVSVVGITVAKEQIELGRKRCEGLPVELKLLDYRDMRGEFDHVISLGMVEHVGSKNYRAFMEVARRCLKSDGLFLLHTIGAYKTSAGLDPWMERYIFPNAHLPSFTELSRASEGKFVMEDMHNFGADYDLTAMAWYANVEQHWPELSKKYDERFLRMWRYYLHIIAGAARARYNQLWQIVYSPKGVGGGYATVR